MRGGSIKLRYESIREVVSRLNEWNDNGAYHYIYSPTYDWIACEWRNGEIDYYDVVYEKPVEYKGYFVFYEHDIWVIELERETVRQRRILADRDKKIENLLKGGDSK
ncbi:hypothetical protein UFOVP182_36 [uncultured Caudovirales phage]|uniref:Uncharacterized protein n=1 Tax=uncultured Caudovirales phage TaxID=2100421 RepID=A0A6J7WD08_9CAUD|nr:hypothetical protein UFOVP182_36 [uncultured Caudovirales phage]